tara:strand:+ start:455 stop:808 length:354 start_codon:yes stop_codon:yes gene_type:complete
MNHNNLLRLAAFDAASSTLNYYYYANKYSRYYTKNRFKVKREISLTKMACKKANLEMWNTLANKCKQPSLNSLIKNKHHFIGGINKLGLDLCLKDIGISYKREDRSGSDAYYRDTDK